MAAHALGMNDVSMLLPLPRAVRAPVVASIAGDGAEPLVDRGTFDALVTAPGDLGPKVGTLGAYEDFQVVAIRFDLCERLAIGVCPPDVPGRLRLVLQPCEMVGGELRTQDIALHAFYPIAAGELAGVIGELRALAAIQGAPADAPLAVSPAAAAGNAAYLAKLHALVMRYARADQLARLTVIGQRASSAAFAWIFRGVDRDAADALNAGAGDRRAAGFTAMAIPGLAAAGGAPATQQSAFLAGGDTVFDARPVADQPAGFALAINGARFAAAGPDERRAAIAALVELQNPARHDTIDTQCLGCHVATYLTARRAAALHVDPAALAGRFAPPYNVAVHSVAGSDPRVVRAFGWAGSAPAISQRVANDTAEVLAEIAARFPPR
jgi:hypothetical protein